MSLVTRRIEVSYEEKVCDKLSKRKTWEHSAVYVLPVYVDYIPVPI